MTIKFSYTMPKGKAYGAGFEWWGPEFEKLTNGRYIVEMYPANTLLSLGGALDGLKGGVAEIGLMSTGMFSTDFPLSQATTLPIVGMPTKTVDQWMGMWDCWWEFYDLPEIQAEYKDFAMLWPYATGGTGIISKGKPVRSAADFEGMSIGAGGVSAEIVTAFGGAAVHVVAPETYMNLDKGVIEGAFLSEVMVTDWGITEVIDYYNSYNFGNGTLVLMANKGFWDSLPADDQKLINETMRECAVINAEAQVEQTKDAIQMIKDTGVEYIIPTSEEEAAWDRDSYPATDKYIADCEAAGIQNSEEILEKYKKMVEKYTK
jgi:TRAP-type C4-dicarboxylate transport system substrate-binding protein